MNTVATNSHAITPLVTAGEALFSTLTDHTFSENAVKVSSGVTSLLDGLFPTLASKVSFDMDGVLIGTTEVLTGLNTAICAAKVKQAAAQTPAITGGA
ncbi:hypothetical protein [Acetobacter orleanensis]|uniref:Uncharacterized protein n=1 Tax=Acetobacter orleanensis TaxID=104099 RepID=A0A4Y3TM29_9PROT|nr:hypothetical protein [Acetobacter orleanensis]KXV62572.1 hypothetical protein AD949_10720 [Acetobacter orleanensis]PCD79982.1 hypothetical protein CO710_03750 [Acetobacter orleanensis]GAN68293.1 hypothetical protein Abol_015_132 [Acetobacter orleanensis JCM 7639]GBR31107.1 hypothetical protein AA0473_2448 [Acetobacter orleanensis NRIC 0473]GEB82814.1 hypothetical protein AOR01nite_12910 [Acetobacter orleanensis]